MKILELGCGNKKYISKKPKDVVIGLDYYNKKNADVIHNLNEFPYPFKDNEFDMIVAIHTLEHVSYFMKTIDELYRITKPNGIIKLVVPHCTSVGMWTNPTHKQAFGYGTFTYFIPNSTEKYTESTFKIKSRKLIWRCFEERNKIWYPLSVINYIVNIRPTFFEHLFYGYLGGFEELRIELEVVK